MPGGRRPTGGDNLPLRCPALSTCAAAVLRGLSALDIVVTVVAGSSLSRALTGNAPLLPALAATAVLVALHTLLSALAPRSELVSRLVKGRPVQLIHDGVVDWRTASRSHFGPRDLAEHLRLSGLRSVEEVEEAHLERNGQISIIKKGG